MGLWQRQLLCPQAHLAADRPLVSLSSAGPNPEADNHPQLLLGDRVEEDSQGTAERCTC